jgi:hypothetical protein
MKITSNQVYIFYSKPLLTTSVFYQKRLKISTIFKYLLKSSSNESRISYRGGTGQNFCVRSGLVWSSRIDFSVRSDPAGLNSLPGPVWSGPIDFSVRSGLVRSGRIDFSVRSGSVWSGRIGSSSDLMRLCMHIVEFLLRWKDFST